MSHGVAEHEPVLVGDVARQLDDVIARYPNRQACLLPALWLVQEARGCTTSPCGLCGAEDTKRALLEATGCRELGATSPDGRFTVIEVECLGACGFPTPVMIDDDFIESVTAERVPELVARYR